MGWSLNTASETVETLRAKMNQTASLLPEYPVVMEMNGVGPTLGPQLSAEIGDVTRFEHRGSLAAYAGVDPRQNESGDYKRQSNPTTKKGSPYLRKTLFQIMDGLIKRSPVDDPVFMPSWIRNGPGQAIPCLHDRRGKQIPAHLLRSCERFSLSCRGVRRAVTLPPIP